MDIEETNAGPDPIDPRSRYRLCQTAFFLAAMGSTLSCLTFAFRGLGAAMRLMGGNPALLHLTIGAWWECLVRGPSLLATLFAGFILIGRWPDRRWRLRATTLAALTTFGLLVWAVDQAELLGLPLPPDDLRQDMLKQFVSAFLGSVAVLLLSGSAEDVCRHLGREGPVPTARAAQLAAGIAAALVGMVMASVLDWGHGWPFREARPRDANTFFMYLGYMLSRAVAAAFTAMLCAQACAACGREVLHLERVRQEDDPFGTWTK